MKVCKTEGCNRGHYAKGYCKKHYQQVLRYGGITDNRPKRLCKVEGCNNIHLAKGYCNKHWQQINRFGKILERSIRDPNEFIFEDNICRIKLYNQKKKEVAEAVIDAGDYNKCKGKKWYLTSNGYVVSGNSKCILYLQHLILGRKTQIDHIDTDKLNNRKNNLRFCITAENSRNCRISKNNTSGYKGVSWSSERKKWTADIMHNYKHIYLGEFSDKIEAAKAYNEAALKYHKEYARLNVV